METVVVISESPAKESDVVAALRGSGFRVVHRWLSDDPDETAVDGPDVCVLDVPADRRVKFVAQSILEAPGMGEIPVIAVIVRDVVHETAGLRDLSDFIVRPLRPREVIARVRRPLVKRGRDDEDRIRMGELVIDLKGYEASIAGDRLDLTYQEFELLKFLASNPGQAFSRDQLLARVWGYDYYGGSRTVDIHVRRIRAKLGHPYARCIETIRNVGYKWRPNLGEDA